MKLTVFSTDTLPTVFLIKIKTTADSINSTFMYYDQKKPIKFKDMQEIRFFWNLDFN